MPKLGEGKVRWSTSGKIFHCRVGPYLAGKTRCFCSCDELLIEVMVIRHSPERNQLRTTTPRDNENNMELQRLNLKFRNMLTAVTLFIELISSDFDHKWQEKPSALGLTSVKDS